MIINASNLEIVFQAYNAAFIEGQTSMQASSMFDQVAMETNSTTREEKYGWLGQLPGMREWLGERVVHAMEQHDYAIVNKDFELTVGVDRNTIEDDEYGIYSQRFRLMGAASMRHYDELVWPLLAAGFGGDMGLCYDGQYLFDGDHPYEDKNGNEASWSNTGGGAGTAWYLLDDRQMYRPIILQRRKSADMLVRKDEPRDDNVFDRKEYLYGIDCRDNVGFGWWQVAYGSRQALDADAYADAVAQMKATPQDRGGAPLGIMPTKLVVPPALEQEGREILMAERNAAGATNVWRNSAELVVVPWLA